MHYKIIKTYIVKDEYRRTLGQVVLRNEKWVKFMNKPTVVFTTRVEYLPCCFKTFKPVI